MPVFLLKVAGQVAKAVVERFVVVILDSVRVRAAAFGPRAFPVAWDARFAGVATFEVRRGDLDDDAFAVRRHYCEIQSICLGANTYLSTIVAGK